MKEKFKMLQVDKRCLMVQEMVFAKTAPGEKVNNYLPRKEPGKHVMENGNLYVNDLCYGDKYPNSHLDLWYPNADHSRKRPVIVFFHGGGFIFGDKVTGDPLVTGKSSEGELVTELLKKDYCMVCANYALAPEYRFPVQIEQVDQVLAFLIAHGEELALDTDKIFLGGGSAGADMAEVYGAVLTNPDYAKKIGINPSVKKDCITGLLINEAALSTKNFNQDMSDMLGCLMGVDDLPSSEVSDIMDATKWINETYPPSFICSSNMEIWFEDSANDLVDVLKKNGVDYVYYYRGQEYDKLEHGFMGRFAENKYAKECLEEMIGFMEKRRYTA